MALDPRTPVLVGVGQVTNRPPWAGAHEPPPPPPGVDRAAAEPLDLPGAEPVTLMAAAVRRAAADAGDGAGAALLRRVDSVRVVGPISWHYVNAAAPLAQELGLSPRELAQGPIGGNTPLAIAAASADAIAAGQLDVVVVAGGECLGSRMAHRRSAGGEPPWTVQGPDTPAPVHLGTVRDPVTDEERAAGLLTPVLTYPLFEVARRAAAGRPPADHRKLVGGLWSRFADVAADNPWAWDHARWEAGDLTTPGPGNRMLSSPYTKRLVANDRVDQGAALLLCSVAAARAAGVPEERWVFPWAVAEANDHWFLTNRWDLGRSPAIATAGRRVFADTGTGAHDVAHVDLYSCFPCAVEMGAEALGLGLDEPDRPLTVTGGLTFFGGPINSYAMHGIAQMALVLRADPGALGVTTALGWYATKHAVGLWSTRPPEGGWRHASVQDEVDALPSRHGAPDHVGPATVETCTVAHDREGRPERAVAALLTADGRRTWATSSDAAVMAELAGTDDEPCGRSATVDEGRVLHLG